MVMMQILMVCNRISFGKKIHQTQQKSPRFFFPIWKSSTMGGFHFPLGGLKPPNPPTSVASNVLETFRRSNSNGRVPSKGS